MRKAFIAVGILIFLVYCWASVAYQNQVNVPGYKLVDVDLLHGMSRDNWEKNQQEQFQRLMALDTKNYQLPVDAPDAVKRGITPDKPLTSDDFAGFITNTSGQPVKMTLRDPAAIYGLAARNYLLRDSIPNPADPDGAPLYVGGHPVDKPMLDDLREKGIGKITVTGHAAPVNFQVGTALMIALIFFTLAAALKPVVWAPFMTMLEKRRHELETGAEADRQNQVEKSRFEEEKRRRHAELGRDIQSLRMEEQRETAKQAGAIVREARDKEKDLKLAGLRDIGRSAAGAREEMRARIPELAQAVADAVTPKKQK